LTKDETEKKFAIHTQSTSWNFLPTSVHSTVTYKSSYLPMH